MHTIYGIKNCDTVKKALRWLDANSIEYSFHDFKTKGIDEKMLKSWIKQVGWEPLINKKGLTWKQLPEERKVVIKSEKAAVLLMQEKTSVIKRPVLERDGRLILLGFDEAQYKEVLL